MGAARRWARLTGLMIIGLGGVLCGCAHNLSGRPLALSALEHQPPPVVNDFGWSVWLWLAMALATVAAGVWALRRGAGQAGGPPLSREELALYRTARDALGFLVKKRLRAMGVISIDSLRPGRRA